LDVSRKLKFCFAYPQLISNGLTDFVHAKLASEFTITLDSVISRSQSELWYQLLLSDRWVQMKNGFTFWLFFGLSRNFRLREQLS